MRKDVGGIEIEIVGAWKKHACHVIHFAYSPATEMVMLSKRFFHSISLWWILTVSDRLYMQCIKKDNIFSLCFASIFNKYHIFINDTCERNEII